MNNLITKKQTFILLGCLVAILLIGLLPDKGSRPTVLVEKDRENISELSTDIKQLVMDSALNSIELSHGLTLLSQDFLYKDGSVEDMFLGQMKNRLQGAGIPLRIESAPEFVLYSFKSGDDVEWIVWLDESFTDASDLTANFPAKGSLVRTERFLKAGETESLKRGYLVEDGVAKILVSTIPVFISIDK